MTTLKEISRKSGVGIFTLRKLVASGYLKAEDESADAQRIKAILSKQRPLSVAHLVELLADPTILDELGRYQGSAQEQIEALGGAAIVKAQAAPREICALIDDAANNRPDAVESVAAWVRSVLPAGKPVSYVWLAVRLVWNSPENLRAADIKRVSMALVNARPHMAGWWRVVQFPTRKATIFERPKFIDL